MCLIPRLWAGLCAGLLLCTITPGMAQDPYSIRKSDRSTKDLSKFIEVLLNNHPRMAAARAAVEAARAGERAAGKPVFNPELEFEAETAETDSFSLGLSQTIDWSDRRSAQASVARFEREASEAELEQVKQSLAIEGLLALSDAKSAQDLYQLAQRRLQIMSRFSGLAERRYRAGDLGQVELDLARLAAAQARFEQAQTAANQIEAQQALAAVIGDSRSNLPLLTSKLPALDLDHLDLDSLLEKLPNLRVLRNRIAAGRAMVQIPTRERRPNPTFGFRGGREESDTLLGVSISVPLLVRNDLQAEVDVANAELIKAQQEGQDTYRQARARLISTAERYRILRGAWEHWEQTGKISLKHQIDLLQRIWQAGEIDTTDYLVQLKQTLDTRSSALELRAQFWRAWFEWLAASGQVGGWLNPKNPPSNIESNTK
ncbi:MAG: TolC family protein [Gammaproteobacteria bacterium]|nr:TolC family protein [Gammaproteobacteria bacterium]